MLNLKALIDNNPKTAGSIMFLIGGLSLSLALKLLGDAISAQSILKYLSNTKLIIYIGSIIILAFVSYKLLSKSYTLLTPFLK